MENHRMLRVILIRLTATDAPEEMDSLDELNLPSCTVEKLEVLAQKLESGAVQI